MEMNRSASTAILAAMLVCAGVPMAPTRTVFIEVRNGDGNQDGIKITRTHVGNSGASAPAQAQSPSVAETTPTSVVPVRQTTASEELAGEIRSWVILKDNWDGEASAAPNKTSLALAANFALALGDSFPIPQAQLLENGNASLFWSHEGLIADLEFRPDSTITYYLESDEHGVHKGAAKAREDHLPPPFPSLLVTTAKAGPRKAA